MSNDRYMEAQFNLDFEAKKKLNFITEKKTSFRFFIQCFFGDKGFLKKKKLKTWHKKFENWYKIFPFLFVIQFLATNFADYI